jgi:primosomal protein N' (replication factor Y)
VQTSLEPTLFPAPAASVPAEQPALDERFAEVALFIPLGRSYSFSIPAALAAGVVTGARVVCGLRGRRVLGVVLAVKHGDAGVAREKLKPILAVVDAEPVVPSELLSFTCELANYYLAPIGEVLRMAVPAVERTRARELQQEGLSPERRLSAVGRSLAYVVARAEQDADAAAQLSGQAKQVWLHLAAERSARLPDLVERWGNARAAVKKLEALGLVVTEQRSEIDGTFFSGPIVPDVPPELNAAQQAAVSEIELKLEAGANHAFLLQGVTASGKTEVYLRAVQAALERGGSALILVPEIALTPQLVGRFRARLGDTIAVLHSGLSQRQRHGMWTLLYNGERRVAVGARSALFAPLRDLRLVCVDEEQDGSFKQEEGVRYNARSACRCAARSKACWSARSKRSCS